MLPEAAAQIGDAQVRNCGTIGGNVAHADPASDLPTVLLALGAKLTAVGPGGERVIDADHFFKGMMTTDLAERELLTTIQVAVQKPGEGMAYVKFTHPASRYAVVGAAAVVVVDKGICKAARVAIGGLLPAATRLREVESALEGAPATPESIAGAAKRASARLGDEVLEDIYASAAYRKSMAIVYVRRALTLAIARAA
jgi:carbon-monoxide dehydrogenase medium subunit